MRSDLTMKGLFFKYKADPHNELMKDTADCEICPIVDPDFWTNEIPVWGVCGPYFRSSLTEGDKVFFIPRKDSLQKAGLNDYICTGILVVGQIIPDSNQVMNNEILTDEYKQNYLTDLKAHLKRDKPRTKKIRPRNFIIGDRFESPWFGKNENYLKPLLKQLGIIETSNKLHFRRIPNLNDTNTKRLYNALT